MNIVVDGCIIENETKCGCMVWICDCVSNERGKKFYLKSVHESTISSEELLKPTQITYKNKACKHYTIYNSSKVDK